ncbi:MAG: hypothetical protein JW850_10970 [Thermoflexales bacterium]|nr:hypothetical protein [Thermoflexales bacterium]
MTYDILVRPQPGGTWQATVLGWPELSVASDSEQGAIERIRQEMHARLAGGKVVRVDVETATSDHPWLPFLGIWKDDPTFDDFVGEMESYRRELDESR